MRHSRDYILNLVQRYPKLLGMEMVIWEAIDIIIKCYDNKGKLLTAGNGGSASDAEHIVGELMKGFVCSRKISSTMRQHINCVAPEMGENICDKLQEALPAISLVGHSSLTSAYLNDVDGIMGFAQQVYGFGNAGDVFWALTTSGNSQNVINASIVAKAKGLKVIALTGGTGGKIKAIADVSIIVPESETYIIQEYHLPIYHCICLAVENYFFGTKG